MTTARRYATIAYTRSYVRAATLEWNAPKPEKIRSTTDLTGAIEEAFKTCGYQEWKIPASLGGPRACFREAADYISQTGIRLDRICVTGFGPFKSMRTGRHYGVTSTRADKPFRNEPLSQWVEKDLGLLPDVLTDVAAMAVCEYWRSVKPGTLESFSRNPHVASAVILGEGIGAATVQHFGQPVGQHHHSEYGHIFVMRHPDDDLEPEEGGCGVHLNNCCQGRASSVAIAARIIKAGVDKKYVYEDIDNPIWDMQAFYIAQLCLSLVLSVSPTRIVFGGSLLKDLGIQSARALIDKIRIEYIRLLNDTISYSEAQSRDFFGLADRGLWMLKGGLLHSMRDTLNELSI